MMFIETQSHAESRKVFSFLKLNFAKLCVSKILKADRTPEELLYKKTPWPFVVKKIGNKL